MKLYDRLDINTKHVFLDVVAEFANNVSQAVVEGVVTRFKIKSTRILTVAKTKADVPTASLELDDATETRKLLFCLASLTSCSNTSLKVFALLFRPL